ncbi:MAG: host-nuclease inhibitor Gam family protein [Chitinophagaceae bacterium]|nr:host-nuclease inhibitor Gam family protein [Chitinophagaceae bacterium]
MATRISKKVIDSVTRDEAEESLSIVARNNSELKKIEAQLELEKQRIDEKYRDKIQQYTDNINAQKERIEVWAKSDYANWEGKSMELTHGTVGFRTTTPKLEKKKGFTWDAVTELLQKHFPALVRTKSEPDKEMIISMRDEDVFTSIKEKCYLNVTQDETFFIKLKEEELAEY